MTGGDLSKEGYMNSYSKVERKLYDLMVSNGVDEDVADRAAKACLRKAAINGSIGTGVFATVGVLTSNPAALLLGAVGGIAGFAGTFAASESCSGVRAAAEKLAQSYLP